MSATSYVRGYPAFWDSKAWRYDDTFELVPEPDTRPCPRCGKLPTPEGYDACLGYIPEMESACCGHGVYPGYFWPKR